MAIYESDSKRLLNEMSRMFLALYPMCDFPWKEIRCMILKSDDYDILMDAQKSLLNATVWHAVAVKYPPSVDYSRLFLKELIKLLEGENCEILDDIYSTFTDLITTKFSQDENFHYRTLTYALGITVSLLETKKMVTDGSTGLFVWEASEALSRWCIGHREIFHDKNILELGSGLGLTGLVVSQGCQPKSYIFTDHHSAVLAALMKNVSINFQVSSQNSVEDWDAGFRCHYNGIDVHINSMDWETAEANEICDVILGADLVFDISVTQSLVNTIYSLLMKNVDAVAFIASTLRNEETHCDFQQKLQTHIQRYAQSWLQLRKRHETKTFF